MIDLIYINGSFVQRKEATLSLFDRGFLYGDGIFEGIRIYNNNIFKCAEHVDRLFNSAKALMIDIGMSKTEMISALVESVRRNGLRDGYIRLIVTRGNGDLGLDPQRSLGEANIFIIVQELALFSQAFYEQGIHAVTVPTRRNLSDALDPKIKSLNYLNNILAKMESNLADVGESLMVNAQGYVTEGSADNIFLVRNGIIYTPPTYVGALEGITRQTVIDIALKLGFTVKEEPFTRYDVYVADEVFLTGTAVEIISVVRVDGRQIDAGIPGNITKRIKEEFHQLVEVIGVQTS